MTNGDEKYYCVYEKKPCNEVANCMYRAKDGKCALRKEVFRKLGTLKKVQQSVVEFARMLLRIWVDPKERVSSHDRKYADKADRD